MWIMNSCFLELDTKAHCVRNVVINWETRSKEGSVCPPSLCLPWVSIIEYKDTLWIQPSIHSDVNLAPFLDVLLKLKELRTSLYRKILSLSSSCCHDGFFQPSRCAWCDVFESALDFEQVEAETWLFYTTRFWVKIIVRWYILHPAFWKLEHVCDNNYGTPFRNGKFPLQFLQEFFTYGKMRFFSHLAGWRFTERFGASSMGKTFPQLVKDMIQKFPVSFLCKELVQWRFFENWSASNWRFSHP